MDRVSPSVKVSETHRVDRSLRQVFCFAKKNFFGICATK